MKSKRTLIILCAAYFLCAAVALPPTLAANAAVVDSAECVTVCGTGKIIMSPDTAELSFGMQLRAKTLADAQTAMNAVYTKVMSAVKSVDADAAKCVLADYSCAYPVCENGLSSFEVNRNFTVRTKNLSAADQLITAVGNAGAVRFNGTRYLLEDTGEAYKNALVEARKNACAKVASLYQNAVLRSVREVCTNNYCAPNSKGYITVEATIEACFEI